MFTTEAWTWQERSEPGALEFKKTALSALKADHVLIKNKAVGLNPVDWKILESPPSTWQTGHTPGVDGMGEIIALGSAVQHLRIGTRVAYHTDLRFTGSFARHTAVAAHALIPIPETLTDSVAAAFPCPAMTAWQAMKRVPELAGSSVLINGAGGAVGGILTQLLTQANARVYATSSEHHHSLLNQKGALEIFDYHQSDWHGKLQSALKGHSLHATFDMVSQQSAESLGYLLGYYGHLVSVQDRIEKSPVPPFSTSISLHEIALAAIHIHGTPAQWQQLTAAAGQMLEQISRGELLMPAIKTVAFAALPDALDEMKNNNNGVKYVAEL
ncbi:zinc-binding dehydrogenase [Ewingella sp. S1.OA.A_B6]